MSEQNEPKMSEKELMEKLLASKRVTRNTLEWVTRQSEPDGPDEGVVNATIAIAAKMTTSPTHLCAVLDAAAWMIAGALGFERAVTAKRADFPPPDTQTRRAIIMRMIELRDAEIDFMPVVGRDEDEHDKASALVTWARARFNPQNQGELCFLLAQTIALLCMSSIDPEGAMTTSAQVILDMRDSHAQTIAAVKP